MNKAILIVEDSSAMRRLISSILEEEGEEEYEIIETQNGFEALKILPRHKFSLILLDINMPDINGLELLSFLKSNPQYQSIPTVVISTEGKEEDQVLDQVGQEPGIQDRAGRPHGERPAQAAQEECRVGVQPERHEEHEHQERRVHDDQSSKEALDSMPGPEG